MAYKRKRTEARRAWERAWYAKNRDKVIEKVRAYQSAHTPTEEFRARHYVVQSRWQANNLDAHAQHVRRARLRGGGGRVTKEEWRSILKAHGGRCFYCGSEANITIDHVIPLSRGGEHAASNLVPACRSCNSRKGARLLGG